jgi:alkylated DNA repair dioxygenase AlkB
MSRKRTLDGFFKPTQEKKPLVETSHPPSDYPTYPFPIPQLPKSIEDSLGFAPAAEGRVINDLADLDLLYFQPYIPKEVERDLFKFLRQELFFYRVQYKIKRGAVETQISTPRWTTVFGVDDSSFFGPDGSLLDSKTSNAIPQDRYKCKPRPIPGCLNFLRKITEGSTGCTFNFCLVNYYASGNDSISFHSDDERFLGLEPAIASFSLGGKRDFLMKHKPIAPSLDTQRIETKTLKLPLASGDMIPMRGSTQSKWLHSIPKRKGGESDRGRINITFRKALVKGGTENYYQYNVGAGRPHRWDKERQEMVAWVPKET